MTSIDPEMQELFRGNSNLNVLLKFLLDEASKAKVNTQQLNTFLSHIVSNSNFLCS